MLSRFAGLRSRPACYSPQERFACGGSLDTLFHHLKFNINDPA